MERINDHARIGALEHGDVGLKHLEILVIGEHLSELAHDLGQLVKKALEVGRRRHCILTHEICKLVYLFTSRRVEFGFTHSLHGFHTGCYVIVPTRLAPTFAVHGGGVNDLLSRRLDFAVEIRVAQLVFRHLGRAIKAGESAGHPRFIEGPEKRFGRGGWGDTGGRDFTAALHWLRQVCKDISLADYELFALGKEEGGNTLEIGRQELTGRGENVDETEEGSFVEGLDSSYHLLTVWTLVAVEENGDIGVCGH